MKKEKYHEIPHHMNYMISVIGTVINKQTCQEVEPFKKSGIYYVMIDNTPIEVAALVLSTFVGEFPAEIEYKK